MHHKELLSVLLQCMTELVKGELEQLQNKSDLEEQFQAYLARSFSKTASVHAYSCKANGILASSTLTQVCPSSNPQILNGVAAFSYCAIPI